MAADVAADRVEKQGAACIAFVCEGDAEKEAFSGSARSIVEHLRALGHAVSPINVRPPKLMRLLVAAGSFSCDRARWRARFRYGELAYNVRSAIAAKKLAGLPQKADLVFQIGATFTPPGGGEIPYALYCDWNMILSARHSAKGLSAAGGLVEAAAAALIAKERKVYEGASRIFTISERLRGSFIHDYGIAPERVVTAYAGPNVGLEHLPPKDPGPGGADRPETILFIGREFHRKGGDLLVEAFKSVRLQLPRARLLVIGPTSLDLREPGVEVLGSLRNDVPEERERLLRAFAESDLLCLPSRLDPFPNVVREAMFCSLPCVTSDIWAMPEMVVDGVTGFTVPVENSEILARRLLEVLTDGELARRMGAAGRERAETLFRWPVSARIMHDNIQQVVRGSRIPGA